MGESTPGKDRLSDEFAERVRIKKEEDAKIIITPAVLPVKEEPPKVEEEAITVEAVAEVESTPGKDKVRDEFAERERLKKEEEAKIIITPAVLPAKKEEESEEESEEEEEPEPAKKKLSKADLKSSVQIKMAAAPVETITRRKKKEEEAKIIITPAVLPAKEEEEESEEEEEEE